MRALRTNKLLAAVIGMLIAVVPIYWLTSWLEEQGMAEVSVTANWAVAFLDLSIDQASARLRDLADRGVDSCSAANIETLHRAVFASAMIKELTLVGPSGQTLCTDAGAAFVPPDILASASTSSSDIMLDVVREAGREARFLRVRLVPAQRKPALAALLPVNLLLPRLAPDGDVLQGVARLTLADGTLLGAVSDEAKRPAADYISAQAHSKRYGPVVSLTMRRRGTVAGYDDLRRIGIVVSGMFAVAILIAALFIPRRESHSPIAEIETALVAGEFIPYYQPIMDIKSGRLLGAEVLVRWRKRDGAVIGPNAFIPLIERSSAILDLTRALMRQVRDDVGTLIGGRQHMYVTFNIAPRHFADAIVFNDIGTIFEGSPIRLSQLVLEITERFEIENLSATRRVIAALQGLGCRVALDDVGTGHSGLSYILKLGVDIIKIDRLFVEALKTERHAQAIVDTLVKLARDLRMQIVAEGVERLDQVEYLREHGISAAQGYVFAPPLPAAAFAELVEAIDPLQADGEQGVADAAKSAEKSAAVSAAKLERFAAA